MKNEVPEAMVMEVRKRWLAAQGRDVRKQIVADAAQHMNVSASTLYRKLKLNHRNRSLGPEEAALVEEKNALAKAVWDYRSARSVDSKTRTLRSCFRYLQSVGQLPPWFTEKMCYDAIERMELKNIALEATMRFTPFEREHPRSMYQIDFTKSDYLKWNGREIVMTDGRWSREEEMYVWIGAAIDDCSRCHYAEYILTPGENATVAQRFIVNAMSEKEGMMLLQGIPREIYVDRGPGFQAEPTANGLRRMGIRHIRGADHAGTKESNKQARGKVESLNKFIVSSFEQSLQDNYGVGHKFSLAELNGLLRDWSEMENQREHPTRKRQGIWNVWRLGAQDISFPAADALAQFSKEITVKVARRMLRVAKGVYYDAPAFLDEGVSVEISRRQDECFVLWKGQEIKLTLHSKSQDHASTPRVTEAELIAQKESDVFTGPNLKDRFDKELRAITRGELTLATLPQEYRNEIKPFFQDGRTLKEIREAADEAKMQLVIAKEFAEPVARTEGTQATPSATRGNIIQWTPTNSEAARLYQ